MYVPTGYFVVGGENVANVNLPTSDPNLKFRRKFLTDKGQTIMTSFISNGNHGLNAIVLVYNEKGEPLQDLELKQNQPFLKLNDHLIDVILDNLLDIVIYSRRGEFAQCTIYERLCPILAGRQYTLREYDTNIDVLSDMTLNRCTFRTERILPEAFKLGAATPGSENDCTGFHFIMENYAPELFNTVPQVFDVAYKHY